MTDVLEGISEEAGQYVVRTRSETEKLEGEKLEADTVWLLDQLRPFALGGGSENLGRQREFGIEDEWVVSLDLTDQGDSIGGHTSLLMGLLISQVYERAKGTDNRAVSVVDEARYLLKDVARLDALQTPPPPRPLGSAHHADGRRVPRSRSGEDTPPISVPSSSSTTWPGWTSAWPTSSD